MKTTKTKKNKTPQLARHENREKKTALLRDLMKPRYIFGLGGQPYHFITDLPTALEKLEQGEDFYVYPGGDLAYQVWPGFYQSGGTPYAEIVERLCAIFPPPPEAIGL